MTEFIVPAALGLASGLGVVGFMLWRRSGAVGATTASLRHAEPAGAGSTPAPQQRPDTESIVIDPVAMKIVNRVAPGTRQVGQLQCVGGLMVEGTIEGELHVTGGPLVLMPNGVVAGRVTCDGEAYLFGTIRARSETELSELDVLGAVFLTEALRAQANITAGAIKSYDGAQVDGRIRTVRRDR